MNVGPKNTPLTLEGTITQARDFLSLHYSDTTNHDVPKLERDEREKEVMQELL